MPNSRNPQQSAPTRSFAHEIATSIVLLKRVVLRRLPGLHAWFIHHFEREVRIKTLNLTRAEVPIGFVPKGADNALFNLTLGKILPVPSCFFGGWTSWVRL
jgi:hypothetical protein